MRKVESVYLTKDRESLILGRGNDVGQHINIDALNKLQAIPWELNENILHLLQDTLKPTDKSLTAIEEQNRMQSFKLREKETNNVINYLLENGNKFWFNWAYDKRGRSYSKGYHINPQGNEYRKAMLNFADKELLTETGKKYLLIDIANQLGHDKETWFHRTIVARKVVNDIFYKTINGEQYNRNQLVIEEKMLEYAKTADAPLLFIKAIYAWKEGVIEGKPIGHNMGLDGTA